MEEIKVLYMLATKVKKSVPEKIPKQEIISLHINGSFNISEKHK